MVQEAASTCRPPAPKSQSQQHLNPLHPRKRKEEQGRSADDSSEAVFISPSGGQTVAQLDTPPCPSLLTATARCRGLRGADGHTSAAPSAAPQGKPKRRGTAVTPAPRGPRKPGARVTPGGLVGAAAPPGSPPRPSGADFGAPRTPGASAACSPHRALLPPGTGRGCSQRFPPPSPFIPPIMGTDFPRVLPGQNASWLWKPASSPTRFSCSSAADTC